MNKLTKTQKKVEKRIKELELKVKGVPAPWLRDEKKVLELLYGQRFLLELP